MVEHDKVRQIILFVPSDEELLQQYISEQKKNEKLLNLYRESHRLNEVYQNEKRFLRFKSKDTHKEEYLQLFVMEIDLSILRIQIKALEEELK